MFALQLLFYIFSDFRSFKWFADEEYSKLMTLSAYDALFHLRVTWKSNFVFGRNLVRFSNAIMKSGNPYNALYKLRVTRRLVLRTQKVPVGYIVHSIACVGHISCRILALVPYIFISIPLTRNVYINSDANPLPMCCWVNFIFVHIEPCISYLHVHLDQIELPPHIHTHRQSSSYRTYHVKIK
jgi:hypothetical protein